MVVFSDGFGYVFFRGVASAPSTGGLSGVWRGGSGVFLVTFRNELRVFYPLNFTSTLVGSDCAVSQSLGVYISPERSFSFSLAAPSLPWR